MFGARPYWSGGVVATGFWAQFMWSMGLVHSENVFAAGAIDSAVRADAFDLLQQRSL